MSVERSVNEAADEALTNAMYRYTFGIIGNGVFGLEGRGIGTGVGVLWNSTFLILTAAHTMQTTPNEQLYFLLPREAVAFLGSGIYSEGPPSDITKRVQLQTQQFALDDERDLAAFILPEQTEEQARRHFYLLDTSHTSPQVAKQIGFMGYPEATRLPAGANFMATPYSSFGEMVAVPNDCSPDSQMAVSYRTSGSVDPHGLSGGGLWMPTSPAGALWTPAISLVGLVIQVDPEPQVLLGLRVEELVRFLETNLS
jgi:hypothetical protein